MVFSLGNCINMFGTNRPAFGGASQPFGSTASPFGSQPQRPASSTFGIGVGNSNNNAQSGFGGFGASNNAGSGNTTGSLFGMSANNNTTNNSPFGNPAGAAASTNSTTGGNSLFGASTATTQGAMGTAIKPYEPYQEKDPTTGVQNVFQTITTMPEYRNFSLEELRMQDYQAGRRFGSANGQGPGTVSPFGSTTTNTNQGFGMLGNANQPQSAGNGGGLFGQRNNTAQNSPFGSLSSGNSTNAFGGAGSGNAFGGAGGSTFGMNKSGGGGLFGSSNQRSTSGGLFGQQSGNTGAFGQQPSAFGGSGASAGATGGAFGANNQNRPSGLFGQTAQSGSGGLFGSGQQSNTFGQPSGGGSLFGQPNNGGTSAFGQPNNQATSSTSGGGGLFGSKPSGSGGLFGQSSGAFGSNTGAGGAGGLFGQNNTQQQSGGLFGQNNNQPSGSGLFGQSNTQPTASGGLFGQNNTTSNGGGLFGQNNASQGGLFGQQNASSPFGQPSQNNAGGGLFGNKPAGGGGLFGQQQSSTPFGGADSGGTASGGLFGQNNNNQPAGGTGGLFGQNNNNAPFGSNTNTGLFGQSGSQPSSTGGGLFGQNNNQQQSGGLFGAKNTGGGLFAQNNSQPQAGGLFGNNQPSQQQQGGGLFGNNNMQQQQQGGGMFGNKPAGTPSGGLFGGAPSGTQTTLGQPSGGGLFGAKPASAGAASGGGGFFGNNNSNANTTQTGFGGGGGLFGNNSTNNTSTGSGGLFSSKPGGTGGTSGGLFGANNNTNSQAGIGGGGLFGNKPANTSSNLLGGGLFGGNNAGNTSNTANTAPSGGLFGSKPQQVGQSGLQGSFQSQQTNQNQGNNPYGTNELFSRVVVPSSITQPTKPSATKINADIKKKASLTGAYRLAPRPLFTTKSLSAITTPKFDGLGGDGSRSSSASSSPDSIGKELVPTSTGSTLFSPETDEAILTADKLLFNPDKKSFKNLIINKKKMEMNSSSEEPVETEKINFQSTSDGNTTGSHSGNDKVESTVFGQVPDSPIVSKDLKSKDLGVNYVSLNASPSRKQTPDTKSGVADPVVKPRGVVGEDISFTDNGYYISPSLETLASKSLPQLRKVSGLVIGHKDYGKIEFLEPVDLSNTPLALLCGNIIVFEPKSCIVYPNSSTVPGPGEGINVRARISCYNCYPTDKATRAPIKDANHQLVKRHIEKLKKLPHTKFDSYDPTTGCWTFVVDHPVAD